VSRIYQWWGLKFQAAQPTLAYGLTRSTDLPVVRICIGWQEKGPGMRKVLSREKY